RSVRRSTPRATPALRSPTVVAARRGASFYGACNGMGSHPARRSFALGIGLGCLAFTAWASAAPAPAAPDYARAGAWAWWPGRASGADAVPPGLTEGAMPEAQKVDVFFIHPTTYLVNDSANARYDEPGATTSRIDRGVLRFQASAFNACCRIY